MTATAPCAHPAPTPESDVVPDTAKSVPVLDMVRPLLGFPDAHHFALSRLDETGTVCDLRCVDVPDLSFVVVPPGMFFADYAPEIEDDVAEALGTGDADDLFTLVLVTLGDDIASATANLMAPVVVNHRTRRAAQVVLDGTDLPLRAALVSAGTAPA